MRVCACVCVCVCVLNPDMCECVCVCVCETESVVRCGTPSSHTLHTLHTASCTMLSLARIAPSQHAPKAYTRVDSDFCPKKKTLHQLTAYLCLSHSTAMGRDEQHDDTNDARTCISRSQFVMGLASHPLIWVP